MEESPSEVSDYPEAECDEKPGKPLVGDPRAQHPPISTRDADPQYADSQDGPSQPEMSIEASEAEPPDEYRRVAAQQMGDTALAKKWFKKSASYQTTFYGQLAANEGFEKKPISKLISKAQKNIL